MINIMEVLIFILLCYFSSATGVPTESPSNSPTTSAPTGSPVAPTMYFEPSKTYQEPTLNDVEVTFISLGLSVAVLAFQSWVIVIWMSSFRIEHDRIKN